MKTREIKEKSTAELEKILPESCDKLRELNFKDANKQLKDVRQLRKLKKTIAKIKTILKERQLEKQAK